ncbi:MAG: precorrin-2 C(20)-methyltransferase [Desulfobacteraceae bacterium 4572_35.1]|nr:MAG: precorrin-2 C(20)-methyltransferase [Desulfobacteraceae bacterium 4572_35.1]
MSGMFYAVGVGPGDPELLTLKAVRSLQQAAVIYIPTSPLSRQSWLADVVQSYAAENCIVHTVKFSLGINSQQRQDHWQQVAGVIIDEIKQGKDVAFVTLGDPLLYSVSIYLLRALRQQWYEIPVTVIPGVSAYAHAAALTEFAVGEGDQSVTILPTVMDRDSLRAAIKKGGTLVLMKIGKRLAQILDLLVEFNLLEHAVFVARAGLPDQRIETDLTRLQEADPSAGNLAIILVDTSMEQS